MSSPHFQIVQRVLADILEVPANQITPESSPDAIYQWDSIRHMNMILALEGELGLEFSAEEIEETNDVPKILALLTKKLG